MKSPTMLVSLSLVGTSLNVPGVTTGGVELMMKLR